MSCDLPVKIAGMPSKGCVETGGEVDEQWEGRELRLSETPPERARQCSEAWSAGSEHWPSYTDWSIQRLLMRTDTWTRYHMPLSQYKIILKV